MAPHSELPPAYRKPLPITARQPFCAIWVVVNVLALFVRVPFWALYYVPRSQRQNPDWTWWQAFAVNIGRFNFSLLVSMRPEKTARAAPGGTSGPKELFERIEPVNERLLQGTLSPKSTSVRPEARPGSWYPSRYDATADKGKHVLLYFFGGAYVVSTHAPDMYKGTLDVLLPALGNAKYFGVGYRLASSKGNHFPAQLLDALSAYQHLLNKGIVASKIILIGDSSGGNLVLALLRYITELPELQIPLPAAAIIESAWVDLSEPMEKIEKHPKYYRDVLPRELLEWGVTTLVPGNMPLTDRYISPGLHPFKLPIPLYISTDDGEIFVEAIVKFAEGMKAIPSNDIQLLVNRGGCHATYMIGSMVGFHKTVVKETEAIKTFLTARNIV